MLQWLYQSYLRLEKKFYDGPSVFNYPGRYGRGYRSVNLMVAQWIRAFSVSYFTPAGRVLIIVSAYIFLNGILTLLMPIYYLSITLWSLFVIDILTGWLLRPRLKISREIPELVAAETSIPIRYALTNVSRHAAWDIYVDTIPFPAFIKFLSNRAFVNTLAPGETINLTNTVIARKRGCYRLPLPVVDSSFPFGLWRWGSRGQANHPLLVYPAYTPLRHISLPLDHRSQSSGNTSFSSTTGQSIDFHGCREFRYGDNPRYIHALSWARLREPIVKEFTDENTRHIALVVDTFAKRTRSWNRYFAKKNEQIEASLRLASAAVDYLVKHQFKIDLFINTPDGVSIKQSEECERLDRILKIFASIQGHVGKEFKEVPEGIITEVSELSVALVFLLDWDEARRNFIRNLEENGVATKTICVSQNKNLMIQNDDDVLSVSLDDIISGNVKEL